MATCDMMYSSFESRADGSFDFQARLPSSSPDLNRTAVDGIGKARLPSSFPDVRRTAENLIRKSKKEESVKSLGWLVTPRVDT